MTIKERKQPWWETPEGKIKEDRIDPRCGICDRRRALHRDIIAGGTHNWTPKK